MLNSVKINDFLFRKRIPVDIDPETEYSLVTIKLYHKGVVLREKKKGALLGSKMYRVSMGDFILSGIDARNGAFGIVPEELDGAIVTNDFWYFDVDETKVKRDFFYWLTATPLFLDACQKSSQGETQRIRLQRKLFNDFEFRFPPIDQQIEFMKSFSKIDKSLSFFSCEITKQSSYLVQLRQAILQEAIEGKLTADWRKQNSVQKGNPDFDAEALLKKVKIEKEKLIARGEIKKQKPLAPIKPEEMPFELPDSWVWGRYTDIFNFIDYRGVTPKKIDSGVRLITAKNVRMGFLNIEPQEFISLNEYNLRMTRGFPKQGDLLFTTEAPLGNICELILNKTDIITTGQRLIIFQTYLKKLELKIFMYFIMSPFMQDYLKDMSTGMTAKGIKGARMKAMLISIPPILEQKEIVKRVDKFMTLIDKLEEQVVNRKQQSKKLMQSVLKEALEG